MHSAAINPIRVVPFIVIAEFSLIISYLASSASANCVKTGLTTISRLGYTVFSLFRQEIYNGNLYEFFNTH